MRALCAAVGTQCRVLAVAVPGLELEASGERGVEACGVVDCELAPSVCASITERESSPKPVRGVRGVDGDNTARGRMQNSSRAVPGPVGVGGVSPRGDRGDVIVERGVNPHGDRGELAGVAVEAQDNRGELTGVSLDLANASESLSRSKLTSAAIQRLLGGAGRGEAAVAGLAQCRARMRPG